MLLAASCASRSQHDPLPYTKPPEEAKLDFEILDYQDRADGAALADWAALYMIGGIPALEKTDEFAPYYVFVAEQSSRDLNPLLLWRDNFNVDQDFPQLFFLRVYRRLTEALSINPDETYGVFFETLMKRVVSLHWPQARQYAGTWLLARYYLAEPAAPQPAASEPSESSPVFEEQPETPNNSRRYIYLILTVIEKSEIENILKALMDETSAGLTLQREQAQAVNAVKSNFFSTF
ncbi:MAG: hypothetical protein LBJ86_05130 [Spirochaetaceae bacterium]|nr:hypothetical protein [Spirochaetaceae bacterium]